MSCSPLVPFTSVIVCRAKVRIYGTPSAPLFYVDEIIYAIANAKGAPLSTTAAVLCRVPSEHRRMACIDRFFVCAVDLEGLRYIVQVLETDAAVLLLQYVEGVLAAMGAPTATAPTVSAPDSSAAHN